MQESNRSSAKWRDLIFFSIALLIILADQFSKVWIRSNIPLNQTLSDFGFLRIINIHNTGAAFGLFRNQSVALAVIATLGAIVILVGFNYLPRWLSPMNKPPVWIALGLIIGGTIGNLIDRLHLGYVTDFVDFKVWPAFNVADSSVTIGVIILVYSILRLSFVQKK